MMFSIILLFITLQINLENDINNIVLHYIVARFQSLKYFIECSKYG